MARNARIISSVSPSTERKPATVLISTGKNVMLAAIATFEPMP